MRLDATCLRRPDSPGTSGDCRVKTDSALPILGNAFFVCYIREKNWGTMALMLLSVPPSSMRPPCDCARIVHSASAGLENLIFRSVFLPALSRTPAYIAFCRHQVTDFVLSRLKQTSQGPAGKHSNRSYLITNCEHAFVLDSDMSAKGRSKDEQWGLNKTKKSRYQSIKIGSPQTGNLLHSGMILMRFS
ncbi:hypothetical protein ARMSODRAFT_389917 [Armillaria solidipes]|uniref:Uncharacterized protein n=1 Tax=Armillaria solidipes TaxID=1076256 RepID=A0A2H3CAU6_9AGAR|nr:hypothetical protein ARMSODRAFT_389917 [Armillaria solidipes]